jgi:aminoglycoside phosphotransferase (APT) family kinase protein
VTRSSPIDPLAVLRALVPGTPAVELAGEPTRLAGGRSADLYAVQLATGPDDLVDRPLVLRVSPPHRDTLTECVVQRRVALAGYPAPEVLRFGRACDATCLLMARVEGPSLFDELRPIGVLRKGPSELASAMLALHALDAAPLADDLVAHGCVDGDTCERALAELQCSPAFAADPTLREVRLALADRRPETARRVICHGDLHALNVMVDGDGRRTVIDWESAGIGSPACDVARTMLLLGSVPMELPRPARPLLERLGRRAARRFAAEYAERSAVDAGELRWYEALHAARVLARIRDDRGDDAVAATWVPTVPYLCSVVERGTGVAVTPWRT